MPFFKDKNFLLFGLLAVLLLAIPLTVYIVQKQQEVRSHAAATTVLSFSPTTATTGIGQPTSLDVMLDPGQNQVSFVKLVVTFDPTKLATASGTCSDTICPNTSVFNSILEGPIVSNGTISITMSVGADPTRVIQTKTKIATVTFQGVDQTASTPVGIDTTQSQVLSIASTDQPSENVLQSATGATITVGAGPTPTPGPAGPTGPGPVCTSLSVDRTPSGSPPFSITFTANGTSSATTTISKVTFNFGDGPVTDVTSGNGIGTKTVSVPIAHTYHNAGTFTASAVLTDGNGNISGQSTACTQTINVVAPTPGPFLTPGPTATPTPTFTPTPTPSPTPTPTPAPIANLKTGPGDTFVGVGIAGTVLTVLGALLFIAL